MGPQHGVEAEDLGRALLAHHGHPMPRRIDAPHERHKCASQMPPF
jgi:hypothetical protein